MGYGPYSWIEKIWAERKANTVTVYYQEGTIKGLLEPKIRLITRHPSRFRAVLYQARINADQFSRYENTELDTGFKTQ